MVSWFNRFPAVNGFMVLYLSWCQWTHGFIGFVVSMNSWFYRFRGVKGFIGFVVSIVSWFHRFRGVNGFIVSKVSWCH